MVRSSLDKGSSNYATLTTLMVLGIFGISLAMMTGFFVSQQNGFRVSSISDNITLNGPIQAQVVNTVDVNVIGGINVTAQFPSDLNISVGIAFPTEMNVNVLNPTTTVSVDNFPATQNITVSNLPAVQDVYVTNPLSVTFPSSLNVTILNPTNTVSVDNFPATQTVNVDNFPATQDVYVTNPLSVSFPSSLNVTVLNPTNTVSVDNFPTIQQVNVSNFPATQDVYVTNPLSVSFPSSLNVSVNNLPAVQDVNVLNSVLATSVSNFPATQNVNVTNPTESVSVNNFPATQNVFVTNPTTTINATITSSGPVDNFNFPYINIASPQGAFGSVMTESLSPIFQATAVYGINFQQTKPGTQLGGTAIAEDSSFVLTATNTLGSGAYVQSRSRLRYRSGQGSRCMFSAIFQPNTTLTYQVAGLGSTEDGVFFGYYLTNVFGILHINRGKRSVRRLTITTASTTTESISITLNGVVFSVPVTNSGNTFRTAYEISRFSYSFWGTQLSGATVTFVSDTSEAKAGVFSISGTTVVGSFTNLETGTPSTKMFIPQSSWNGNTLSTLDVSKYNVYMISMQYLGAGAMRFFVEAQLTDMAFPQFINVHTIVFPNTRTSTTFSNPSFPFTAFVYNAGYPANATVKTASFAGFVEGYRMLTGNRFAVSNTISTVTTGSYTILFTIYNPLYYAGRTSQGIIHLLETTAAVNHGFPVEFFIFRTMQGQTWTVTGSPNFQQYNTNSAILVDTSALLLTPAGTESLIWSGQVAQDQGTTRIFSLEQHESITLQPGEYFSLCARSSSGAVAFAGGSISIREDY